MNKIGQNLQFIKQEIATIAKQCQRDPETITLVAVSKTKTVNDIKQAIMAGQLEFGENYVQEGVDKIKHFMESQPKTPLIWHFIGPLQSNKTRLVAEYFDWIHTIERLKIAERLSIQRPTGKLPINVLIQINISEEISKSGIAPSEMMQLAKQISTLPNLTLRGLMAIPSIETDTAKQRLVFEKMKLLFQQLKTSYPSVDTLSMGMSNDMASAIESGSTLVRIGSAIFGARNYDSQEKFA
ncbi:MAG: YggS family pyridoxal phosphate-dependent enzyme [Candidatus Schmidhempelia sp.]|nr:YggS family pyridoxal phosphate-dependent enzyme [Candidatus Schmidhempelia sp.]